MSEVKEMVEGKVPWNERIWKEGVEAYRKRKLLMNIERRLKEGSKAKLPLLYGSAPTVLKEGETSRKVERWLAEHKPKVSGQKRKRPPAPVKNLGAQPIPAQFGAYVTPYAVYNLDGTCIDRAGFDAMIKRREKT